MTLLEEWEAVWPEIRRAWQDGTLEPHMKVDPVFIGRGGARARWDPVAEGWHYTED